MLLRLFLAFTIIPLIELFLLVRLAQATSFGLTVVIVLATGVLGSWLARNQGLQVWMRFQSTVRAGRMPSRELQEGLMIAFAAALLLTPGLLTDLFGFLLLVPPTRELVRQTMAHRLRQRFHMEVRRHGAPFPTDSEEMPPERHHDPTIDAEGVRPVDQQGHDEETSR